MIALVILKILVSNEVDESPIRTVIAVPGKTNAEICNTIRAKPRKKKRFSARHKKNSTESDRFFSKNSESRESACQFLKKNTENSGH